MRAVARADVWANSLQLKVDAKRFTTNDRKYIVAPLRDSSDEIVIKKAAQMGFTVGFIVVALHKVTEKKLNGMYLLPFKQGARTFVQARIDPILESSPQLKGYFHNVANVSHKQTNESVNFYIRGTNIRAELVEAPVDFEIWDERDRFVDKFLGDARARMDASSYGKLIQLSTPTAPGIGIDADDNWRLSDQCKWEVACPHCGRYQTLAWDENIKLGDNEYDSVLECSLCHKRITETERIQLNSTGRWVPQYLDGRKRGYHITQLNSPNKNLRKMLKEWFDAVEDAQKYRDFVNLVLGEPYAGRGDKFEESILDKSRTGDRLRFVPDGPIFGGVDVGAVLHGTFHCLDRHGNRRLWDLKIFRNFNQLEKYLRDLHNFNLVIDAHPETTKAKELAKKFKGHIWLGLEKDKTDHTEMTKFDDRKQEVSINRTMAFDQYIWDFERGKYILPKNARELGEHMPKKPYSGFYAHHFEMVRVPTELPDGRNVVRWVKTRNKDHWHHSGMFSLIAMQKRPTMVIPANISQAFANAGGLIDG
jgi:hypothetical protein